MMPVPLGKLLTVLLLRSALVTFATVVALPKATKRMPDPSDNVLFVELVTVLFEMFALVIVPL